MPPKKPLPPNFVCPHCPYTTKWHSGFIEHSRLHTGERPFKCTHPDCTASFRVKGYLTEHQRIVHEKVLPFKCTICSKKYGKRSHLDNHMRSHSEERPFQCTLCPCKTKDKYTLQKHIECVHETKHFFKCPYCKYAGTTEPNLRRHLRTHPETSESRQEKRFSCPHCPHKTFDSSNMTSHMLTHTDIRPFACDLCGHRARTKVNLQLHVDRIHLLKKTFKCFFCYKDFCTKGQLEEHIRSHTGERPYKCPWKGCPYAAISASVLKVHSRVHTKEKLYPCSMCEYKGTNSSNLNVHVRRHTGEMHFTCDECPFQAVTKGQIQQHAVVHTGVKPFNCEWPECDYTTNRPAGIKSHEKTHLKVKSVECQVKGCKYTTTNKRNLKTHMKVRHSDKEEMMESSEGESS